MNMKDIWAMGGEEDCDSAEIVTDLNGETYSLWVERLPRCPFGRWVWSADVLEIVRDRSGKFAEHIRAVVLGFSLSANEARYQVEEAIRRMINGELKPV